MILDLGDVVLRPLDERDIDELYLYRNDPHIVGSLGGFSTGYSRKDLADWLQAHRAMHDEVLWCIAEKASDTCRGHVGLYRIDHRVRKGELAIMLGGADSRRKGIGTIVCNAVIEYARAQLNLRRIELSLLADNVPARALYSKLGFVTEGVQVQAEYRDGSYVDIELMALLLEE